MNFGQWRVQIVLQPPNCNQRIYLWQHVGRGTRQFVTHKNEIVTVQAADTVSNDDLWFAEMDDDQLQSFANAMADKGIRTTNDSKNEGLLEATNKHLEDMRSLVFKGKQS